MIRHLLLASSMTGIMLAQGTVLRLGIDAERQRVKSTDPQPLPGDRVEVDPTTGDVVATSGGLSVRFPKANAIVPTVEATVTSSGSEFTYSYRVLNRAGARQHVIGFFLEGIDREDCRIVSVPEPWKALFAALPGGQPRLGFIPMVDDNDQGRKLGGGRSAGPFVVQCAKAPGMVDFSFIPNKPNTPSGELSEGERLRLLSPWAYRRVTELESLPDRQFVKVSAMGPRITPGTDSVARIRMDIAYASQQAEFGEVKPTLDRLVVSSDRKTLESGLRGLKGTAVHQGFVEAMLQRLRSAPDEVP